MPRGWSLPVLVTAAPLSKRAPTTGRRAPMSFISVEPQSRVLLESHSNSLLAQFDSQLKIITVRYLAFFQERCVRVSVLIVPHFQVALTAVRLQAKNRGNLVSCHPNIDPPMNAG